MQKNRYVPRAKISDAKFRQFLRYFAIDLEATKIAMLTGLNRNTVNRMAKLVRMRVAAQSEMEARMVAFKLAQNPLVTPLPHSAKRFANRQVIAWISPEGHVHIHLADGRSPGMDYSSRQLNLHGSLTQAVPSTAVPGALAETRHDSGVVAESATNVKLLDYFWSHTQLRLAKFKGTAKGTFELHLKESEFRFNHRRDRLYPILLQLLRQKGSP